MSDQEQMLDCDHCGTGESIPVPEFEGEVNCETCGAMWTVGWDTDEPPHLIGDADLPIDALRRLVETLPKCSQCDTPATRAYGRGGERYCDAHGIDTANQRPVPDYPRAGPLRRALKLLGK